MGGGESISRRQIVQRAASAMAATVLVPLTWRRAPSAPAPASLRCGPIRSPSAATTPKSFALSLKHVHPKQHECATSTLTIEGAMVRANNQALRLVERPASRPTAVNYISTIPKTAQGATYAGIIFDGATDLLVAITGVAGMCGVRIFIGQNPDAFVGGFGVFTDQTAGCGASSDQAQITAGLAAIRQAIWGTAAYDPGHAGADLKITLDSDEQ